jgi:hypothetical protein
MKCNSFLVNRYHPDYTLCIIFYMKVTAGYFGFRTIHPFNLIHAGLIREYINELPGSRA